MWDLIRLVVLWLSRKFCFVGEQGLLLLILSLSLNWDRNDEKEEDSFSPKDSEDEDEEPCVLLAKLFENMHSSSVSSEFFFCNTRFMNVLILDDVEAPKLEEVDEAKIFLT